jgi:BMFP domain-containing protein YqiC
LTDAREVIVVQLQLLDLMIRKENDAVPMDAMARADLIDLMARILALRSKPAFRTATSI